MRNVLNEGWGVSVVLPFGHAFGGKPGNGGSGGSENVPMAMVVPMMVFCLNVVAHMRADPLVM